MARIRIENRRQSIDFRGNLEVGMIYVIFALCALAVTFFACRYFAAKALLVEREIDKAIARRFESSGKVIELAELREENAVMRNLLLDLLENEAVFPVQSAPPSRVDLRRMGAAKVQRYREILAESQYVLQQRGAIGVFEDHGAFKDDQRRS
ncbi:hypothetical protein FOB27_13925 [Rhizobium pusense]|uniref:Uncharacterized protein n=2 Tax=Agrobacterium pusense TaxID=648995 RepID=A0AA44EIM4_9HYPH|nr:hypothetical protein [Agrobacterium pusense]MBM7326623.1 hypothetical protein [Agrobacterium sp. S2]NRF09634.1 hypothetical protein [Agrobacterium pusense]NRF19461.1 hypothetical protein [Agrobacterium pusense]